MLTKNQKTFLIVTVIVTFLLTIFAAITYESKFETECFAKNGVILNNELGEQFCFRSEK